MPRHLRCLATRIAAPARGRLAMTIQVFDGVMPEVPVPWPILVTNGEFNRGDRLGWKTALRTVLAKA